MERQANPGVMKLPPGAMQRERFASLEAQVKALTARIEALTDRLEILEAHNSSAPKSIDDMKAGELIAYATENNLDIGGLVPQSGKEKILAAVKAALAAKG